jgi:hypothetical protein
MTNQRFPRRLLAACASIALVLLAAGCGGSAHKTHSPQGQAAEQPAASVSTPGVRKRPQHRSHETKAQSHHAGHRAHVRSPTRVGHARQRRHKSLVDLLTPRLHRAPAKKHKSRHPSLVDQIVAHTSPSPPSQPAPAGQAPAGGGNQSGAGGLIQQITGGGGAP